MPRPGTAFLLAACVAAAPPALADLFPGLPDAIVCSVRDPTGVLPWDELVFYPSARMRGGDTLYKTLTSDPVVLIVRADGVVAAATLADCDGRRVDELRRAGRARDLGTGGPPDGD